MGHFDIRSVFLASAAVYAVAASTVAAAEIKTFNVASQPALTGVPELARQADIQILVRESAVRGKATNSVRGKMTVDEALRRLLEGTGLHIRSAAVNTYTLAAADVAVPAQIRTVQYRPQAEAAAPPPRASAATSPAQDAGPALEDIVVTAQKRAQNLQSVPIAVTAVSNQQLQSSGVTNANMLPTLVSGLSIGANAGSWQPYIRGIGTTAVGAGIETPVALYIDDVYYASQLYGFSDLSDVAQVNVLKGPQSTLFGRNATGGVIQLTTREPSDTFGGQVLTELDNYLRSRSNAYVTGGLTDTLKANLSGTFVTQGKGWGENLPTGNDTHRLFHDISARSKFVFTPDEATTIKLLMDFADRKGRIGPQFVSAPGQRSSTPGNIPLSDPYDANNTVDNFLKLRSGGASLNASRDLGFARLVSISAYREYDFFIRFDLSQGPKLEVPNEITQKGKQFSQELQLISRENETFNWVLGAYYFYARDRMPRFEQNAYNEFLARTSPPGTSFTRRQVVTQSAVTADSAAVFGQATAELLPKTHLTLGARYTDETRTINGRTTVTNFNTPPAPNIVIAPPAADKRTSFAKLTYRAALDYKFTRDVLGYVSYNRGFKSGGFNAVNPGSDPYRPELVDTYEAGVKSELLDRRVRLNIAAFYNKYTDIQIVSYARQVGVPVIFNAANAENYGVDVDLEARLTEEIRIKGGMEYLHARFGQGSIGTIVRSGPGGLGTIATQGSIDGNTLAFAPTWSANLGVDYTKDMSWGSLNFNVTDSYSSGFYGSEDNFVKFGSYHILNASVTWTSPDNAFSLALFGRNLLDKAVPTTLGNGSVGYFADYGNPPLTYGVTATFRFGSSR